MQAFEFGNNSKLLANTLSVVFLNFFFICLVISHIVGRTQKIAMKVRHELKKTLGITGLSGLRSCLYFP